MTSPQQQRLAAAQTTWRTRYAPMSARQLAWLTAGHTISPTPFSVWISTTALAARAFAESVRPPAT
jgi:hypothetical protein